MAADTFVPGADLTPSSRILDDLDRASRFGGPVLLLQGDTHEYLSDQPSAGARRT
jgi:hypothetical protein